MAEHLLAAACKVGTSSLQLFQVALGQAGQGSHGLRGDVGLDGVESCSVLCVLHQHSCPGAESACIGSNRKKL